MPVLIFCVQPKIYSRKSQTFCSSQKDDLHSVKLIFVPALNAIKFWDWLKKIGPAQNILGPVKGQGINPYFIKNLCGWHVNRKDVTK